MEDRDWLVETVSRDPSMVEYLATSLAHFMATNRKNRQAWTKLRVAQAITSDQRIEGTLNDTTLGRFLDPRHSQTPTSATVRRVAHFLLLEGGIARRDIELHAEAPDLRLASALNGLNGNPESDQQVEFLQSLDGQYLGQTYLNGHLLFTRLVLSYSATANALLAKEVLRLFSVPDSVKLTVWRDEFAAGKLSNPEKIINATGGREIEAFASSGFVMADRDLAGC